MKWMCSADAHLSEPPDLWTSRMPKAIREDPGASLAMGFLGGAMPGIGSDDMPPPEDVPGRLALLDEDGIWAETIIGNRAGLVVLSIEEPEVAMASARAYNDYLAEIFGPHRARELGIAFIPVRDIDLAVQEIERVAELGLPGITLPMEPPEPYWHEKYEALWSAADAHRLPVSFHATTGGNLSTRFSGAAMGGPTDIRSRASLKTLGATRFGEQAFQVVGSLVGAGVLERYPELHFVFVETNAAWLAGCIAAMDATWAPIPGDSRLNDIFGGDPNREDASSLEYLLGGRWPYPMRPSEYVRRQVHATFQDEVAAIELRHYIGIESLMWGSDFPHPEGTWPHTHKVVDELFADVPQVERDAIVGGNLARVYGIAVPA